MFCYEMNSVEYLLRKKKSRSQIQIWKKSSWRISVERKMDNDNCAVPFFDEQKEEGRASCTVPQNQNWV